MKVGVFDSGLGGLTVLKKLIEKFPNNEYIYYADLYNMPYGKRSQANLIEISTNIISHLKNMNIEQYICACGTLSSTAMDNMKNLVGNQKIYGIITALTNSLVKYNGKRILILGTPATIAKGELEKSIALACSNSKIYTKACDEFVRLIEDSINSMDSEEMLYNITKEYLLEYKSKVDVVVCGCTHYILFEKYIKQILGNVIIIEAGESMVEIIKTTDLNEKFSNNSNDGSLKIILSKYSSEFVGNAESVLKVKLNDIEVINKK